MGTRTLALVWPTLRTAADPDDPGLLARFEAMLDRLDELSPRVQSSAFGVALVDVTGLEALMGDEPQVAARAAALVNEVEPLALRLGIGDNRWLATVAARCARRSDAAAGDAAAGDAAFERIAPGDGRRYLAQLPIRILPADAETHSRFVLFGLTAIGQLADLSRSAVGAQFGVTGERLHALARGEDPRPIVPRRRPERVAIELPFEPPLEGLEPIAFAVRRCCGELCETLRGRHLAPGRASLEIRFDRDGASGPSRVEVVFPQPALESDWIARLIAARLEAALADRSPRAEVEEARVTGIHLAFDRLSDPWARQLPAFEPQAGRWEELRWSLERMRSRFGPGRLMRAIHERPMAARAERRVRLVDIGLEADAPEAAPP